MNIQVILIMKLQHLAPLWRYILSFSEVELISDTDINVNRWPGGAPLLFRHSFQISLGHLVLVLNEFNIFKSMNI